MKLEEAIEMIKTETGITLSATDLVLTMTKSKEFEDTGRFTPIEWTPKRVEGTVVFIDGNTYRVTVEAIC